MCGNCGGVLGGGGGALEDIWKVALGGSENSSAVGARNIGTFAFKPAYCTICFRHPFEVKSKVAVFSDP